MSDGGDGGSDDRDDRPTSQYDHELDGLRLSKQVKRVWLAMRGGEWLTLSEIEDRTGDPQASISARLRDFRKKKFGQWTMEARRRGDPMHGLFEYCLFPPVGRLIGLSELVQCPRLTQREWRALADELPRVIALAEAGGHVSSLALGVLASFVAWRAR